MRPLAHPFRLSVFKTFLYRLLALTLFASSIFAFQIGLGASNSWTGTLESASSHAKSSLTDGRLAIPGLSPRVKPLPTPSPSPVQPLSISPKQGQQGKSYVITITSTNCEAVNFAKGDYTLLQEENSGIKISGDDKTVDGGCTYTAQLTVDANAPFGDIYLKLKPKSGTTLTIAFSIAAIAPGPVPPGIEPQVDILWSVVPKNVVSDNFGKRVGNNFYCVEIVIGNSTGYDIQLASVGFKVGPIGPYADGRCGYAGTVGEYGA